MKSLITWESCEPLVLLVCLSDEHLNSCHNFGTHFLSFPQESSDFGSVDSIKDELVMSQSFLPKTPYKSGLKEFVSRCGQFYLRWIRTHGDWISWQKNAALDMINLSTLGPEQFVHEI